METTHHPCRPSTRPAPRMYSPRIPPRLIPALYRLARARGQPMTRVVAEAVEHLLRRHGFDPEAINATLPPERRWRLGTRR